MDLTGWHMGMPMNLLPPSTTTTGADTDAARYRRHLEAIFRRPCRCRRWLCTACWSWGMSLHRIPRPEACERHDDRCAACIAEHALYLAGDHEAVSS